MQNMLSSVAAVVAESITVEAVALEDILKVQPLLPRHLLLRLLLVAVELQDSHHILEVLDYHQHFGMELIPQSHSLQELSLVVKVVVELMKVLLLVEQQVEMDLLFH